MMQDSAGAVIGALLGSWLLQYDFHFGLRDGRYFVHIMRPFNAWLFPARSYQRSERRCVKECAAS